MTATLFAALPRPFPPTASATGIPAQTGDLVIVLPWDLEAAAQILRARQHEIAAVFY
eukprot:SAG22_NODE_21010_length_260_cov_1.428571_1_plen_56_part_01